MADAEVPLPYELSPREVKEKLDADERVKLLDVREPFEHTLTRIEGCELIPMNNVPARLRHIEGLAEESLVVVYCHHGVRSLNVVSWLRAQGVANCVSMSGGIEAWSLEVDRKVPRY